MAWCRGHGRLAPIAPHSPTAGAKGGRALTPLETMLRMYVLQQQSASGDPMDEVIPCDSDAKPHFASTNLDDDRMPDGTTILNFRHMLERHEPTGQSSPR